MGVHVEKEYRIKRSGGGDKVRAIRASKSAFNNKVKAGHTTKANQRMPSREVTFKITGSAKTAKGIKQGIEYITREGELNTHLYDGNGTLTDGNDPEHLDSVVETMTADNNYSLKDRKGEPADHVKNIVFSPPPVAGVSEADAIEATIKVVSKRYPGNAFVVTYHDDKKEHPHVHVNLKLKEENSNKRIRLVKSELRELRSGFSKELQQMGYDVKATFKRDYGLKESLSQEPQRTRDTFKLVDFGEASYGFKAGERRTPFVTYETLKTGKQVTVWGKELKQHFEPEKLQKGDLIKIKKLSPTTVSVPMFNDKGDVTGYKETVRNNWRIENLGVNRERNYENPKEVVIEATPARVSEQLKQKKELKQDIGFTQEHGYLKQSPEHKKDLALTKGFKLGF
jgi:hypothetical protein